MERYKATLANEADPKVSAQWILKQSKLVSTASQNSLVMMILKDPDIQQRDLESALAMAESIALRFHDWPSSQGQCLCREKIGRKPLICKPTHGWAHLKLKKAMAKQRLDEYRAASKIQSGKKNKLALDRDLFHRPPARAMLAASVFAADFAALGQSARLALNAGASLLHVDIMDGHFVPNLSMGPLVCAALRRVCPGTFLDVHLMVTDPKEFIPAFVKAGANSISFHVEAVKNPKELAAYARNMGVSVGLASNPDTQVSAIEPF